MISRPPHHDPERDVAAYIAGELSPKGVQRFEAHLLDCDRCWREVELNRSGRRMAEWSWEAAPAHLRENVRAAVALLGPGPRRRARWRLVALSATTLISMLLAAVLVSHSVSQPRVIEAALAFSRAPTTPAGPAERPAPDLSAGGFELVREGVTRLESMPADAFVYRGSSGGWVVLFLASAAFPEAAGATEHGGMAQGWTARADGLFLLCGSRPTSFLFVGTDAQLLRRAERALAAARVSMGG